MAYYTSSRLFEELFSIAPADIEATHNSSLTHETTAGFSARIRPPLAGNISRRGISSSTESYKETQSVFTLKSIYSRLASNSIKLTKVDKAKGGDVVYVTGSFTCGAIPIHHISDKVKKQFSQDNIAFHNERELFHIFGGVINAARTSTNPACRITTKVSKSILLLGSIDNLGMLKAHCTTGKDELASDFPNDYPSTPEAANYLLNDLYHIEEGPRASKYRPARDKELETLRDIFHRTILGGGYGYAPYTPNHRVREEYHTKGFFKVLYSTPECVLLRPLIIQ